MLASWHPHMNFDTESSLFNFLVNILFYLTFILLLLLSSLLLFNIINIMTVWVSYSNNHQGRRTWPWRTKEQPQKKYIIIIVTSIPGFLKTGLAKISTHSTTWQFKTTKLIQRPIKSLYLTPGSKLMVPRSIPTSPNLKWRKF